MRLTNFLILSALILFLVSCATVIKGNRVTIHDDNVTEKVDISVGKRFYDNVSLPHKVKVKSGYKPVKVKVTAPEYEPYEFTINKKFNPAYIGNLFIPFGLVVDLATGCVLKPEQKHYFINMQPEFKPEPAGSQQMVFVNNYVEKPKEERQTGLDDIIIRWQIDSDPKGARIFYRVISSIPAEVHNTNENYMTATPFEETRAFNIKGLTYENSSNVQIEFKITKVGYEDQIKRVNVRQAIDQQEISLFFQLVQKNN